MAFVQLLAVQNRSGAASSGVVPVPAGLAAVTLRIDLGPVGNPQDFIDPAESITIEIEWSRDGGTTFYSSGPNRIVGRADRFWGRPGSTGLPMIGQGLPQPPYYPTHVRGRYTVVGTVRFGISFETEAATG